MVQCGTNAEKWGQMEGQDLLEKLRNGSKVLSSIPKQWKTYTQNAKQHIICSLDNVRNPYDLIIAHGSVMQHSPNCSFFMAAVYFSSIERKMDNGLGLTAAFLQLSAIFLSDKHRTFKINFKGVKWVCVNVCFTEA